MGETLALRAPCAPRLCGQLLDENWIRSTAFGISSIWRSRLETDSRDCAVNVEASTVFESISNTAFVSVGRMDMPTKSKSSITTRPAKSLISRRLPTDRAPTHPGEMLRAEFIEPLGITQTAFAIRLGVSFPRLNEIIKARRSVTPDTALRLAQLLGMPADFWLGLQSDWDLWHAMRSDKADEIGALIPLELP